MDTYFGNFIEKIPQDIHSVTKSYICRYIAIFEPEEFIFGDVLCFEDYHFVLFFSNPPLATIDGCYYQFKKGSLIVIQPGSVVSILPTEKTKWIKYIAISVKKDFFEKVAFQIANEGEFKFKCIENFYSKQLLDLIGSFQLELMNYGESYPLMLESISTQIVFQLIRDINTNTGKISKENKYISKAIQFMQDYYSSNISINDICNMIYLSPCHFKRVFKEYTGKTPYRYLTEIRLEKAKEILKEKENSVEEVAKLCGYVNSGHFATAFKQYVGITPSEYKRISE
ncbi:MAG: helix-turn-helix domain-containing protein [Peptococcales bacterium]